MSEIRDWQASIGRGFASRRYLGDVQAATEAEAVVQAIMVYRVPARQQSRVHVRPSPR